MPYKDIDRQRKYQREWVARRRAKYLSDKSCVRCGSTDNLQIDHINPEDKVTHNIWSWSWARIMIELAKCQVLCEDCHLKKTLAERPKTDHGRGQMYQAYKCRCDLCRAWKRNDDRMRRGNPTGDGTALEKQRA